LARRGVSISVKLISGSAGLLVLVMGLFGAMNTVSSQRIIDDSTKRLQEKISEQIKVSGSGQLRLLAETTRIAVVQSDFTTLQSTIHNIGRHDENVTAVAVVDKSGMVLAHSDSNRVGKKAEGLLQRSLGAKNLTIEPATQVAGQKSMVFMAPVTHEGTQFCSVLLAYSLKPLQAELEKSEKRKKKEMGAAIRNILVVGLLAMLLGVVLTIFQGLRITRPIQNLAEQADRIASGDLEARVEIRSNDEIGVLGERFNFMVDQVLVLLRETVEKASMQKELEVASAIQATLVPDSSVVDLPGITLAGYFKTASQCGGDWWSYFTLADGRTLVLIGDVTGHGVAPAMITAAAKGSVSSTMAITKGHLELQSLLKAMNTAIHDAARGKFVMTCFASIYDPQSRTLTYANAGHNFPYLYQAEPKKLASLVVRGNRLGDVSESTFEIKQIQVQPNDVLVWYTDGIVECEDVRGEEFGERRFRSLIKQHVTRPPNQARDGIVERANEFFGQVPQKDDITLVIAKIS
jgi:serine phosphatase RsbU (regulator of sigma subunit)